MQNVGFLTTRLIFEILDIFQVESLQVNADITTEQFNTIRAKLDKFKDVNEDENDNNLKILDTDQEKLVNSDNEGWFSVIKTPLILHYYCLLSLLVEYSYIGEVR